MNACFLTILAPPVCRSLGFNDIGAEGASKLATILKETKIEKLEYASTSNRPSSVRSCVSAR